MKRFRRIVPAATLVLLMLVLATLWLQRVRLMDWLAQRGYTASASVVTLAADDTMTADARHLFFVNRPVIDQAAAFNKACTNKTEKDVVLGCYHGDRQGIYLYDVTDPRLHGVEQVTAAHEMLHQAYDRLSAKERTRINGLLETYAKDGLTDQRIKDKLDAYKQSEPSALDTEMHSIFGTEVRNLPPALEQYYARYFTDRSKIIAFSDGYQAELASRQQMPTKQLWIRSLVS